LSRQKEAISKQNLPTKQSKAKQSEAKRLRLLLNPNTTLLNFCASNRRSRPSSTALSVQHSTAQAVNNSLSPLALA
jgi:hypothetical protein